MYYMHVHCGHEYVDVEPMVRIHAAQQTLRKRERILFAFECDAFMQRPMKNVSATRVDAASCSQAHASDHQFGGYWSIRKCEREGTNSTCTMYRRLFYPTKIPICWEYAYFCFLHNFVYITNVQEVHTYI